MPPALSIRRLLPLLGLLVCCGASAEPQRIVFEPENPTLDTPLRIVVHSSPPGGTLRWGVNAGNGSWQPPHPLYWPPGTEPIDHGVAVETRLPEPDADGRSVLVLGPFDQGGQIVDSIHAALRWGTQWDSNQGLNYNVELHEAPAPTSTTRFAPLPENPTTPSFTATLQSPQAQAVDLWLNGEPLAALTAPPWQWTFDASLPNGHHTLLAVAHHAQGREVAQVQFWKVPEVQHAPAPEDLDEGAHRLGDGAWGFRLYAPGKRFASLIGCFNDWNPEAHPLHRADDGTWWTSVELPEGRYEYQFLIENRLRIADPFSLEVRWQNQRGEASAHPDAARTVLATPRTPRKPVKGYDRPPLDALIIYELHLQDFTLGEGFAGLERRLDYIAGLGVTALEPLPIQEFPGATGWGYNPAFHFAPESAYGTPDELRELIAAGHRRGLAFILDAVLNHTDKTAPICRLYGDDYDENPYFHVFKGENWGFPKIDQRSGRFRLLAERYLRFWLHEYGVDGFRYDATRWTEWNATPGGEWGAAWFAIAAKKTDPTSHQIAEHIPGDPELMRQTPMDAEWDAHFRWRVRETLRTASIEDREDLIGVLDPAPGRYDDPLHRMAYTESHDEPRVLRELLDAGYPLPEALRRAESALLLTLTVPGIPMIYAGQEFGEDTPKVVGPNPLHWEKLGQPAYARFHQRAKRLIHLRRDSEALRNGAMRLDLCDPDTGLVAFRRESASDRVSVWVNFGLKPLRVDELGGVLEPGEGRAVRSLPPP